MGYRKLMCQSKRIGRIMKLKTLLSMERRNKDERMIALWRSSGSVMLSEGRTKRYQVFCNHVMLKLPYRLYASIIKAFEEVCKNIQASSSFRIMGHTTAYPIALSLKEIEPQRTQRDFSRNALGRASRFVVRPVNSGNTSKTCFSSALSASLREEKILKLTRRRHTVFLAN
jgi:hypothetical protein